MREIAKTISNWIKGNSRKEIPLEEIPRYPPFQVGLPVVSGERIMETQRELIIKIKKSLNLTPEQYAELVEPVIKRYAEFVHLLPASETHHHRGAGGLFTHGLEVAIQALQIAEDSKPFASPLQFHAGGMKNKKDLVWRVAVCVGGLLHDTAKPATDVNVTNRDGDVQWNPFEESLYEWANNNRIQRYFLHWNQNRHGKHDEVNTSIAPGILGKDTIKFLNSVGNTIFPQLMAALSHYNGDSEINEIIRRADQKSTTADRIENNFDEASHAAAVPVETHLKDAIRRLTHSGDWKINRKGARVWVFKEGVFIVWNKAAEDIVRLLRKDHIPGIPVDPVTLAEILINRGVASSNQRDDGEFTTWEVAPDELTGSQGRLVKLKMLKLASPRVIFENHNIPDPTTGFINGERSDDRAPSEATVDVIDTAKRNDTVVNIEVTEAASEREVKPKKVNAERIVELGAEVSGQVYETEAASNETNEPSPLDLVEQILKDHSLVLQLVKGWAEGGKGLFEFNGSYYIDYPGQLEGQQARVHSALRDDSLIVSLDDKPMIFVHQVGDKKGLLFNEELQVLLGKLSKLRVEIEVNDEDLVGHSAVEADQDAGKDVEADPPAKSKTDVAESGASGKKTDSQKAALDEFAETSIKETEMIGKMFDGPPPSVNSDFKGSSIPEGEHGDEIALINSLFDEQVNNGVQPDENGMVMIKSSDARERMESMKVSQRMMNRVLALYECERMNSYQFRIRRIES